MDKERIIDVDYHDVKSGNFEIEETTGLYYNAVQVSKILNENDSTIRHWTKELKGVLNIKKVNNINRYTKIDIDNLKFIQKLVRKDGFTLKQAYDYCATKGFDSEGLIDANNQLAVKTLINALTEEFQSKLELMQKQMLISIEQSNREFIEKVQKDISVTVDEVISDKLEHFTSTQESLQDDVKQDISVTIDEILNEKFNSLSDKLEDIKQEVKVATVSLESIKEFENPKTFISKIANLFSKR